MKVLKGFNNISEELKKTIKPLKGVQTFKLLTGVPVFDPETKKTEILFAATLVPTRDRIKDPFTGNYVDIGIVNDFDAKTSEVINCRSFIVGTSVTKFNGKFDLHEGKIEDEELWEFLQITNFNQSNPHRDKTKTPVIEHIDVYAESQRKRENRKDLTRALNIAEEMSLPEVREFALALNQDEAQDEDVLRDFIEDYAQKNPKLFLKSYTNPVFKIQPIIKRSVDNGLIHHDAATRKVKWNDAKGTTITTLSEEENKSWLEQFAEYLHTSPAGEAVLKGLKKKLKEGVINAISEV